MPCAAGPMTLAELSVPETDPPGTGHIGVMPTTAGGACVPAVWHNHTMMPPLLFRGPKWMCDWVTSP